MFAAAATAAVLARYTWDRQGTTGASAVTVFLLAVSVWSLGAGLGLIAPGMAGKVFSARLEYTGIVAVPPTWLVFILQYTGLQRWLTRFRIAVLFVVPFATWLLFLTNSLHGLMWRKVALEPSSTVASLVVEYGPWFWVHSAYSYLLMLLGAGLLISMFFRASRIYRIQSAIFLIALVIPLLANATYILRMGPILTVDPTPLGFAISGVLVVWGLFRFQLLDILPIARNAVVEGMSDGVVVVDLQNRVVDLNPVAQKILGYLPVEIVGRDASSVSIGGGALLEGEPATKEQREVEVETGGSHRNYELMASELRDGEGKSRGRLVLLRDVTERKRDEEKLRQWAAELAVSNAELDNFASFISHDLRAPLRSIEGFSRILIEDYADDLDHEGADYLRRIRGAGRQMSQFIDDVLDLSRVARNDLRRDTVDLSLVARAVVEDLRASQPERDVETVIPDGLTTEADPNLTRVIMQNLLENAWKFTGPVERPRIEFGAERGVGEPFFYVRDNGVGFDAKHAARLFDTFQRLHAHDEFEGTGIGLATVRRIVRRHGGKIWAEGETGQGATFYFTLLAED